MKRIRSRTSFIHREAEVTGPTKIGPSSWLIALSLLGIGFSVSPFAQQGGPGYVLSENVLSGFLDNGAEIGRASAASLGDLNGDGIVDIVTSNSLSTTRVTISFLDANGRVGSYQLLGSGAGGFGSFIPSSANFGVGVSGIGDLNGDGVQDLAVGADGSVTGGVQGGAVWIIFLNPDGTSQGEQQIGYMQGGFNAVLQKDDYFGNSLACLGDLDGDGLAELAVGAFGTRGGPGRQGASFGAVYILFLNPDGTVRAEQKVDTNNGGFGGPLEANSALGQAVASLGDLDGDGVTDIAVTSLGTTDFNGDVLGAVWILFLNPDGTVKAEQEITEGVGGFTGDLVDFSGFGYDLVAIPDLNHDGVVELAVGAWLDPEAGPLAGAVWILFLNPDGTVNGYQKIDGSQGNFNGNSASNLGTSLACLGDFNGDGVGDLLASSSIYNNQSLTSGVWMMFLDDGEVSASFPYGSGVNPPGSLSLVSGRPSLGTNVTVGLDNPLGTQSPGAGVLFVLSLASDPNFPAGTLLANFGQTGPGASGELLLSLQPQDLLSPAYPGAAWQGAGQPSDVTVPIPNDSALVGLSVYGQGLLIDATQSLGNVHFGLTDAVEFRFGL